MFRRVTVSMKSPRFAPRSVTRLAAGALVLAGLTACTRDDQQGRQSIGDAGAATSSASGAGNPALPLAAVTALDEGNQAFRAKKLDVALVKYREAAVAAPQHAAPWFGIYMAANEMKNTALADSALAHVKSLSADPAALNAHMTVTSPSRGLEAPSGGMPDGHPATKLVMPNAHPAAAPKDSVKRTRM
jgi:hypothetical protein